MDILCFTSHIISLLLALPAQGICTCRMAVMNMTDLHSTFIFSYLLSIFFPFQFLFLFVMEYRQLFPLFTHQDKVPLLSLSLIIHPTFQKAELKGGWELFTALRVLVLNASCPVCFCNKAKHCTAQRGETSVIQPLVCQPLMVPDVLNRCPKTATSFSLLVLLACWKGV